jgi:hypothetical protein
MTTNPPRRRGATSPPSATTTRRTLARLCGPVAEAGQRQGFTGLCVSRSLEQRLAGVLYASNPVGRQVDEMQQVIGEGPGVSALAERSPVLVPDLDDDVSARRWSVFRREADLLGVASLFCFPVQIGAVELGLMTVHGSRPLRLEAGALGSYVGLSDALALAFIAPDGVDGGDGVLGETAADLLDSGSLVTHQAVGMVSVQLECSLEEALVALRSRAYAEGRSVGEMAREVVARRSRLGPDRSADGVNRNGPEVGRTGHEGDDEGMAATGGDHG